VLARWRLGDGTVLAIASNLGTENAAIVPLHGRLLFAASQQSEQMARAGCLLARTTVAFLEPKA
jgi:hypothetical protein